MLYQDMHIAKSIYLNFQLEQQRSAS